MPTKIRKKTSNVKIDLDEAARFLDAIVPNAEYFTFQILADSDREAVSPLSSIFEGTLDEHADDLTRLNQQGAGIFVCVNETDGKGRRTENVRAVRAVFADLDGADLGPVKQCKLKPHVIVETSPQRYHAYWRVKGLSLDIFAGVQRAIAKRFGSDPMVHDLPRTMRLPGFIHRKGKPFKVRILNVRDKPPYSPEKILRAFPPATKVAPKVVGDCRSGITEGETTSLRGKLDDTYAEMRDAFSGADVVIDASRESLLPDEIARGLCRVSFVRCPSIGPSMPDWPMQLVQAVAANAFTKRTGKGKREHLGDAEVA